eukprot:Protomagalhaensia_wolfi_Nauph_80__3819@NODE_386_length_2629_cov_13_505792_g291_i0_p3_GENE_NODE_386_length_2629_cov_13_505792_g291_i0NODE_386_length_2629_cov_13_505792_g291_i0_p3_ORF_typecomplete_len156_score34_15_NODE_386_length_2629_cov_13_505792_g291_i010071474
MEEPTGPEEPTSQAAPQSDATKGPVTIEEDGPSTTLVNDEDVIVEEGSFLLEFPELNSSGFKEVFHTMTIEDFNSHKPHLSLNSVFHFSGFWAKAGGSTPTIFRALDIQEPSTGSPKGRESVVEMVGFASNVMVAEISSQTQNKSLLMIPHQARE